MAAHRSRSRSRRATFRMPPQTQTRTAAAAATGATGGDTLTLTQLRTSSGSSLQPPDDDGDEGATADFWSVALDDHGRRGQRSSSTLPGLRCSASSEQLQRRGSGTDAWWVDHADGRRRSAGGGRRGSSVTADALELSAALRTLTEAARTQTPSTSPSRRGR
eukprot:COSAG02_NODE_13578_length_1376_cov_8.440094_2_plen_161_part_01